MILENTFNLKKTLKKYLIVIVKDIFKLFNTLYFLSIENIINTFYNH